MILINHRYHCDFQKKELGAAYGLKTLPGMWEYFRLTSWEPSMGSYSISLRSCSGPRTGPFLTSSLAFRGGGDPVWGLAGSWGMHGSGLGEGTHALSTTRSLKKFSKNPSRQAQLGKYWPRSVQAPQKGRLTRKTLLSSFKRSNIPEAARACRKHPRPHAVQAVCGLR